MATKAKASIDVKIDERGAVDSLKKLSSEFGRFSVGANQALELVGKAWSAVNKVVGQSIELATKQQAIEARLSQALQNSTRAHGEVFDALLKSNTERQRSLGIDADEQAALQAKLSALGVQADKLDAATKASVGLAKITGGDLNSTAQNIAKTFAGNVAWLKKLGVNAKTTEEALAFLSRGTVTAAREAETFSGKLSILANDVDDLRKKFGRSVTDSEGVNAAVSEFSLLIRDLTDRLDADGLKSGATGLGAVATAAARLGRAFVWADKKFGEGLFWFLDKSPLEYAARAWTTIADEAYRLMGIISDPLATDELIRNPNAGKFGFLAAEDYGPNAPAGFRRSDNQISPEELKRRNAAREAHRQRIAEGRAIDNEDDDSIYATGYDLNKLLAPGRAYREAENQKPITEFANAFTSGAGEAAAEYRRALDDQQKYADKAHDALQKSAEENNAVLKAIGAQTFDTISDGFSQMIVNVANGSMSVLEAVGSFIGGVITQLGTMMIQLGTAAILAGTLGSIVPIFAGVTGGPAGVGAGLALVAGGAVMVGIGSAISGASAPSGASVPTSANPGGGGYSTRGPNTTSPTGFWMDAANGEGDQARVINIHVGNLIGTDKRRASRELRELVEMGG